MKFRRIYFVLCMLLFLVSSISVYAAQHKVKVDLGNKGAGIELSVHKVADIEGKEYVWLQEYKGVKVDLTESSKNQEKHEAAKKLYDWSCEKKIQPIFCCTADETGSVSFDLDAGVYLLSKVSERGTMSPVLLVLQGDESLTVVNSKFNDVNDPENPGNNEPGDKEPGDKDPGDKDPGDKDPDDDPKNPGGSNDKPKKPGDKNPVESAKTGDSANVLLWSAVLVVALAGIAVVVKKNHGRR